jgi:predicted ABC-type transport system involved in lysophospholipase L1 biosynthesis ATPase subunit
MTTLLELRQVAKVYGSGPARVQALREVDLAVEGGELVAVMGPAAPARARCLRSPAAWRGPAAARCWWAGRRCRP